MVLYDVGAGLVGSGEEGEALVGTLVGHVVEVEADVGLQGRRLQLLLADCTRHQTVLHLRHSQLSSD